MSLAEVFIRNADHQKIALRIAELKPEFRRRLLHRLPRVDDSLSASSSTTYQNGAAVDGIHNALLLPCNTKLSEVQLLLSLVKSPNPFSGDSLRLNDHEVGQLMRLAGSREPLPCLPHSEELLQRLCEAYFSGQLSPLKLSPDDEEQLLGFGRVGCLKFSLTAASGAAARRIALEVSKRLGLGLGKELQLNLKIGGDKVFRSWLPNFSTATRASLVLRREDAEDTQMVLYDARWTYPVEAECGELQLFASVDRSTALSSDGDFQLEGRCFHRWQLQEWRASCEVGEDQERQHLRFNAQEVPVQLVGHEPNVADVQILLTFREPFLSHLVPTHCWGHAWLPLHAMRHGETSIPLEVRGGLLCKLVVSGVWHFPVMRAGQVQRNKGLLLIKQLDVLGAQAPTEVIACWQTHRLLSSILHILPMMSGLSNRKLGSRS
eukprot:s2084_g10.t1